MDTEIQEHKEISFLDIITHDPAKRYSRCLNRTGYFRDGIHKIYIQYYDATKKKISRLKDGELYGGQTKEQIQADSAYNKDRVQRSRGELASYFRSSDRYVPYADISLTLKSTPLRDITYEGYTIQSQLDDATKDIADTLELITNTKVKAKVVKLLAELDSMEWDISTKKEEPHKGSLAYQFKLQLQGEGQYE